MGISFVGELMFNCIKLKLKFQIGLRVYFTDILPL